MDRNYTSKSNWKLHPNEHIIAADDSTLTHESTTTTSSFHDDDSMDDGISEVQTILTDSDSQEVTRTNTLDEAVHELVHVPTDKQKEWLQYHYALNHLPITYMKRLAENGVIPKRLGKIKPPICVACLKGKLHRKPWRGRGNKFLQSVNHIITIQELRHLPIR